MTSLVDRATSSVSTYSHGYMDDHTVFRMVTSIYGSIAFGLLAFELLIVILARIISVITGKSNKVEPFKLAHAREAFTSPITKATKNIQMGITRILQ
jgi:hypothetical protein